MPSNLEQLLQSAASPVELLRNSQVPGHSYPLTYPVVPGEFSNWLDEQKAWRETCAFFDLSYHMTDLMIEGPDAAKLLSGLAINSFENFTVGRAKQMVVCNDEGFTIGDGILFHLDDEQFEFVGRGAVANWIIYNAEINDSNVRLDRDNPPSSLHSGSSTRRFYRYQIQGPHAEELIRTLNGGEYDDIKFFHLGSIGIGGRTVRALRHGMSGQPGLEIFGPFSEHEEIRETILEAGQEFGIRHVGARAYPTDTLESGWIPSPISAIYTSATLKQYREWLSADGPEGNGGSLAGSFLSSNIEDYYMTPYELGYGSFIKFDHDFRGADALRTMDRRSQRRKVTLAWNPDDVLKIFQSLLTRDEAPYKFLDLPLANYGTSNYDLVLANGQQAGVSMYTGYSYNERSVLSLAVVDQDLEVGEEVEVVWGEPDGGSGKATVERPHRQIGIRATVAPVPFARYAREHYAEGWRARES